MTLKRKLQQVLAGKQDAVKVFPAVLGNAAGVVSVGGKPNYVYVTMGDITLTAYNTRVAPQPGLPVYVGYEAGQPGLLQVLGVRAVEDADGVYQTPGHHKLHEFPTGADIVWVQLRQMMPLRITPAGGMNIAVYRGVVWTGSGYQVISDTVDLTPYRPTASGKARYVLVTINTSGAVQITAGSEVNLSALTLTDIPAMPSGTSYVLGAIRLYALQTAIQEAATDTDIVDLRFPIRHTHTAAEAGGHDPVTVVDSSTVDFTLSGQQLTAEVKPEGIKLDDLGTPDDNTDLNATTSRHGLLPKLPGNTGVYLRGDGTWATPPGSGGGGIAIEELDGTPSVSDVMLIRVSNGTLTDEGNGVVQLDTGGSSNMDILAVQIFS